MAAISNIARHAGEPGAREAAEGGERHRRRPTRGANAAGAGARLALLSRKKRNEIQNLVEKIEKIETAVEPKFQEHFVEAMAFPHKTNPYSKLASQINLPKFMESKNLTDKIRTRRRRNSKIN